MNIARRLVAAELAINTSLLLMFLLSVNPTFPIWLYPWIEGLRRPANALVQPQRSLGSSTGAVVVASIPTSLWQSRRNPTLRLGMRANDHQE
jgi:hypothetical protein